jgi:hypothetical protein
MGLTSSGADGEFAQVSGLAFWGAAAHLFVLRMTDLDAERVRALFEQLQGSIGPVDSGAYFEVVQDASGVHRVQANAAGFICAGIHLTRQGLNTAGLPDDKPLSIELRQFTIDQDKSGWFIDPA